MSKYIAEQVESAAENGGPEVMLMLRAYAADLREREAMKPARYEARRKNRFNDEWSSWMEVDAETEATVATESVPDEWQFRRLYERPAEREETKGGVTDAIVERAMLAYNGVPLPITSGAASSAGMRAALEAVWPLAAKVEVLDGWQPIETAPIEETVFCYHPMTGRFTGYQSRINGTTSTLWHNTWADESGVMPPTHWMPLPAAPTPPTSGEMRL